MTTTNSIPVVLQSIVNYLTNLGRTDVDFVRSYLPKNAIEALPIDKLIGIVFPVADDMQAETRSTMSVNRVFNICFKARIPKDTELLSLDTFVDTVNEIRNELVKSVRSNNSNLLPQGVYLTSVSIQPVYDFDRLSENGEFLSIIVLRIRESTDV